MNRIYKMSQSVFVGGNRLTTIPPARNVIHGTPILKRTGSRETSSPFLSFWQVTIMRIVQFEIPRRGRRVGVVHSGAVRDLTEAVPDWHRVVDIFRHAEREGRRFEELLQEVLAAGDLPELDYAAMLNAVPGQENGQPVLHPPVDDVDPHHVLISGTGLTHLGSMQSRNQMHSAEKAAADQEVTDSRRIFEMGLDGGKPKEGRRGVAPEWFHKGNGANLRGHRQALSLPAFAGDGGEEAELVGCYIVDRPGTPRRLGFALGNEWSDHATERVNYLYLAPSKLRQCAVGPELVTDFDFQEVRLRCTVHRGGVLLYDSQEQFSGEKHMCHSLANCEDHHFKFAQHRLPGDVHLHYFGTGKLSYSTRDWKYQDGDKICIEAEGFSAALVNKVRAEIPGQSPVRVVPA
jgi:hypothetical protein